MPMIYSKDILFLHVPKAAGVSATRFLLDTLPKPVHHVARFPHKRKSDEGIVHVPGAAHQTLPEARALLAARGIDIADLSLILAIVRNPYDIFVSHYHWLHQRWTEVAFLDEDQAPPAPAPRASALARELAAALGDLRPGRVLRIERTKGETLANLRNELNRTAIELGRQIVSWTDNGAIYVAENERARKRSKPRELARELGFREYAIAVHARQKHTFLTRLYDYFHLDGEKLANLRMVRFENLTDEMKAALRDAGLPAEGEFPWLNRTEHAAYTSYYDAETEEIVYNNARWLFDEGFYQRLPVPAHQLG
jgi:hypothetical protein